MTPEQLKDIYKGLSWTWNAIAQDLFSDGQPPMPRSHVIEVVLDADYLESYGQVPKETLKEFRKLDYKLQNKIAKEVFKAARYS